MNQNNYHLDNVFAQSACVDAGTLLRYANNELDDKEMHTVERHLVDCPFCEDALEGIGMTGSDQFSATLNQVNAAIEGKISGEQSADDNKDDATVIEFRPQPQPEENVAPQKGNSRRVFRLLSLVASVMLIAVVGVTMLNNSATTPESIANEHFQLFDGHNVRTVLDDAVKLYVDKEYKAAAAKFDQIDSAEARFYAANAYYMMGDYTTSAARYEAVIDEGVYYYEDSEYGLAMAYLMLNRVDDAKSLLQKVSADEGHNYRKHATEALKDIDNL